MHPRGRCVPPRLDVMIIVTTNDVTGHRIEATMGECFGLTVRSRHIGSNIGAGLKAMAGGELKGITELLVECRREALSRLAAEAQARGANAVVAFRFETNEFAQTGIEVCAYGTAVYIAPDGQQGGQQAHQGQQGGAQQWNAPASQSMGQQFAGGSGEPSQQWQVNVDAQR